MLYKAYIINKVNGSNKYLINIPSFVSTGSTNDYQVEATLSYQPGNLDGYAQGDCVFVTFEGSGKTHPVIIGKLYLGSEELFTNSQKANNLEVSGQSILSNNTTIGDTDWKTFASAVKSLEQRVQELESKVLRK